VRGDPTFTVVMPAYNTATTIASSIESALAQTLDDFELVIVDDASTDDTLAVAERYASDTRVRMVTRPHSGLAATRNAALEVARGRYVSLLDSDDLWMPQYLEVMCETLDDHDDAGFAYTDAWVIDDRTRRIRRTTAMEPARPPLPPPEDPFVFFTEMLRRNFVYIGVTIRRRALDDVGPFNADLLSSEDYELWLRMLAHGYRGVRAPGTLGLYRLRKEALSADPLWMSEWALRVYAGLAADETLPDRFRGPLRERLAEAKLNHAALVRLIASRQALFGLRPRLGRVRRRLFWRKEWREAPPPELTAVFPDLEAL